MQFFRTAAILSVAAAIATGWTLIQPAIGSASPSGPTTYYVRPGGHDTASGTSPDAAWRSLARASKATLRPGDKLLLLGGRTYHGRLNISPTDAGNALKPILIGSYGHGRAAISAGGSGITVFNTRGVNIRNLIITGNQALRTRTSGIQLYSSRLKGLLGHVYIDRVNISRFGTGIAIGAAHDGAGFRNVRITRSSVHDNLDAGLVSYGPEFNAAAPGYAHSGIYMSRVRAFRNLGDPANTDHNTGSGILLGSVNGAKVTRSVAYGNGGKGGSVTEGPIGVWTYDSTRIIFSHDVSHNNHSSNPHDGGGFGLDREVSHSVMEYNLSYGNHGAGFLLYSATNAVGAQTRNAVRFNLSYGDAREAHHIVGGMAVGGRVNNSVFYHNTIVITHGKQPAFKATGTEHNVKVLNNILMAGYGSVVHAVQPKQPEDVMFAGNDYYSSTGTWTVVWGPSLLFSSLQSWRASTGEEQKALGRATGHMFKPNFVGPLSYSNHGDGFKLRKSSKLRQAGLNLFLYFGIKPAAVTFAGTTYHMRTPNIGAQ
jgi:hypothetical protein